MKKWWNSFIYAHGERMFYGGLALLFSIGFMVGGHVYQIEQLKNTGVTVATGVLMLMFNKARGGTIEKDSEPGKEAQQ